MSWRGRGFDSSYLMHRQTELASSKDEKYSAHYKAGQRKAMLANLHSDLKSAASQMFNFDVHTPPMFVYKSLNDAIHKLIKQRGIDTSDLKHDEVEDIIEKVALELWKIPYVRANHIQPGIKNDMNTGKRRDFSVLRYETPELGVQKQKATEAEAAKRRGRRWL